MVCLCFNSGDPILDGYTDSNMASDIDSMKSVSSFQVTFGGATLSW